MNKREIKYTNLAKKLIKELPEFEYIRDADVKIAFLSSDVEKTKDGKVVFGDCTKVNKSRYDWCCPYDFMITIYEPNVFDFDWNMISILLQHELRHVGIHNDGNEPSFYIVPHDIEDFRGIIEKYGYDWAEKG